MTLRTFSKNRPLLENERLGQDDPRPICLDTTMRCALRLPLPLYNYITVHVEMLFIVGHTIDGIMSPGNIWGKKRRGTVLSQAGGIFSTPWCKTVFLALFK